MSNKIVFSVSDINNIIWLYTNENKSMSYIAKYYKKDSGVIKRLLIKNNIKIRDNNSYKSKKVDTYFFDSIDTEEKAYWLGFIYADGSISKKCLNIKLCYEDIDHLRKFKESIKSEHKILEIETNTPYKDNYKYCSISIVNDHLVNSLNNNGVLYRKSKILVFPTTQQVPKNLLSHFIRGYFDGDGSVYEYSKTHKGNVSFTGTENFLNGILNTFKSFLKTKTYVRKYKNKDIYDLKFGGMNIFYSIYLYLYKDATIYLDRKKNKFIHILNENKIDVQRL